MNLVILICVSVLTLVVVIFFVYLILILSDIRYLLRDAIKKVEKFNDIFSIISKISDAVRIFIKKDDVRAK